MYPKRVLVVDDSPTFLKAAKMLLEDMPGLSVAGLAASGGEALAKASADPPDLILLDVSMGGGLDGFDTLRLLRALGCKVPVLLMSLSGVTEEVAVQRRVVPDGYVDKTDFLNDFRDCVVRLFPDIGWTSGDLRP